MIKKHFLIVAFSMLWSVGSAAPIYGIASDGSKEEFAIGEVRSIKLEPQQEGDKPFPTIVFGISSTNSMSSPTSAMILVYPNPVSEYITISGAEETDMVTISDMQGKVVVRTNGARVDVSSLSSGNYILTINGSAVKFIKK